MVHTWYLVCMYSIFHPIKRESRETNVKQLNRISLTSLADENQGSNLRVLNPQKVLPMKWCHFFPCRPLWCQNSARVGKLQLMIFDEPWGLGSGHAEPRFDTNTYEGAYIHAGKRENTYDPGLSRMPPTVILLRVCVEEAKLYGVPTVCRV